MKTVPTGDLAPPAVRRAYPHIGAAPRLLEFFVPGRGWVNSGPDVYATHSTIVGLGRYQKATAVAVAIGPKRTADFRVCELV